MFEEQGKHLKDVSKMFEDRSSEVGPKTGTMDVALCHKNIELPRQSGNEQDG
jgi:hypothetical protein